MLITKVLNAHMFPCPIPVPVQGQRWSYWYRNTSEWTSGQNGAEEITISLLDYWVWVLVKIDYRSFHSTIHNFFLPLVSKHHILGNRVRLGVENFPPARSRTNLLRPLLHQRRVPLDQDHGMKHKIETVKQRPPLHHKSIYNSPAVAFPYKR